MCAFLVIFNELYLEASMLYFFKILECFNSLTHTRYSLWLYDVVIKKFSKMSWNSRFYVLRTSQASFVTGTKKNDFATGMQRSHA